MQITHSSSLWSTPRPLQLAAAISAAFMLDGTARAFTVTSCGDSAASTSTLRYAVAHAASGETIDLTACADSVITLQHGEIMASQAKVDIRNNAVKTVYIVGDHAHRIFNHTGSTYIHLANLQLKYGQVTGPSASGGCIYSAGFVNLDHVKVSNCKATETAAAGMARGGGIYSKNGVHLVASIVTLNHVEQQSSTHYKAQGGGIFSTSLSSYNSIISSNTSYNSAGGSLNQYTTAGGAFIKGDATLYASAVFENQAGVDAGLALGTGGSSPSAVISNSTIAYNTAVKMNAGIWAGGALTLANSTVAFNQSAAIPAGIYVAGVANLQSSIVARNTYGPGSKPADVWIGGFSGSVDPATANNIVIASNKTLAADTISADPLLLPLALNGAALVPTLAFSAESPALDRGNRNFAISLIYDVPTCDQRGNPSKPLNAPPNTGACSAVAGGFLRADALHNKADIGAYEEQRPNDWIFYDGLEYPAPQ